MTKVLQQTKHKERLEELGFPTQIRKWPFYTTSYLNIVSNTGHATRASTIGSLKNLWNTLKKDLGENEERIPTSKDWFEYLDNHDGAGKVEIATEKMYNQFVKQDDIFWIERKFPGEDPRYVCRQYVTELIYHKTALGHAFEEQSLIRVANEYGVAYRSSNSIEEKQKFDGFLVNAEGNDIMPVQVKPHDYFGRDRYHVEYDQTGILIVTYDKDKKPLKITILNDELIDELLEGK